MSYAPPAYTDAGGSLSSNYTPPSYTAVGGDVEPYVPSSNPIVVSPEELDVGFGYILLVELYFDGGHDVRRVSTDWWYSRHTDSIGVKEWQGRVTADPSYSIKVGIPIWNRKITVVQGSIEVADPQGELDWLSANTRDSLCVLRLAERFQSYDNTVVVGKAIVDSVEMQGLSKVVNLRGIDTLLDRPLQTSVFEPLAPSEVPFDSDGDYQLPVNEPNTSNATSDQSLGGTKVPVVLGSLSQVEPPLSYPQFLGFTLSDAPVYSIDEVMSGGSTAIPPTLDTSPDWDYIWDRTGFKMNTSPSARVLANINGIVALSSVATLSSDFDQDSAWASDGTLVAWSVIDGAVSRVEDVGARAVVATTLEVSTGLTQGDWVSVIVNICRVRSGYVEVRGDRTFEIRRSGRHPTIMQVGAGGKITLQCFAVDGACDVTLQQVYVYSFDNATTTQSLTQLMRHLMVARGALPDSAATAVDVIPASVETFPNQAALDEWEVTLSNVASISVDSSGANYSVGDNATERCRVDMKWPVLLSPGNRYTLSASILVSLLQYDVLGNVGGQVFFEPASLNVSSYINFGYLLDTGTHTINQTFEPVEEGYLRISFAAWSTGGPAKVEGTVNSVSLSTIQYSVVTESVDFDSLQNIDEGYVLGYHAEGSETVREAMADILGGLSAWFYPDASGRIRFGRLEDLSGAVSLVIDDNNMTSYPQFYPDHAPGLSTLMVGNRNVAPYSDGELAGITYPNRPPFKAPFRVTKNSSYAKRLAAPYSHAVGAEPMSSWIQTESGVQSEVNRVTSLYQTRNGFWEVEVAVNSAVSAAAIRTDQLVELSSSLFGEYDGELAKIVDVEGRYRNNVLKLLVWVRGQ